MQLKIIFKPCYFYKRQFFNVYNTFLFLIKVSQLYMKKLFTAIGVVSHVFTCWSYFIEFLLRLKLLFTVLKNYFLRYDQPKLGRIAGSLWEGKTKTANKKLFHLKHTSSYIFHAIFFNLSQSNLYTITKKHYLDLKNFK